MRVIAGLYRSRRLQSLPGMDLRPTSDRLRETLFDVLTAGNRDALAGTVWLDLYAGTGAVGIEALSRGASMVYFVESSAKREELIQRNLRSLGIESGFHVLRQDAGHSLRQLAQQARQADFFFLDPPYCMQDAYQKTLTGIADSPLLRGNSIVIAEHDRKFDPGEVIRRLQRYRKLEQGDAVLSFYRAAV
jgi:16S rRNA (guanine966-N2)-methyltransferase